MKTESQLPRKDSLIKVLVQVWSDNHGHDETFGTQPNRPHYIYDNTLQCPSTSNLLAILANNVMRKFNVDQTEPIHVIGVNSYSGMEELRIRIANSEYCCRAVVTL